MVLKEGVEPREYQKQIAESVIRNGNTLVVLPTGLGKTLIAILVMEKKMKEGAILFLAPTKPLVQQHLNTVRELLDQPDAIAITGEMSKDFRKGLWNKHKIIIATPQTVKSDLNFIDKDRFSLVVLDEVHRAVGNYAYTEVARAFRPYSTLLGLTASPGSSRDKIDEIKETLGITNVESRDRFDEDVRQYVKEVDIEWITVDEKPEYVVAKEKLRKLIQWYVDMVRHYGFKVISRSRKTMIMAQQAIMHSPLKSKYHALKYLSAAINLDYACEMLETQSMDAFLDYVKNLETRDTKGAKILLKDGRLQEIIVFVRNSKVVHPKVERLIEILRSNAGSKFIVFSQYTMQIEYLESLLSKLGFKCKKFMGQRKGFTRKLQLEVIEQFRRNEFDILIASSIGEEGLDIPSVDYVVFYEPIPSEIRSIQRRGRAGRAKKGYVKILITKNTRDEAYYFSSKNKERKMKKIIDVMSRKYEPVTNTKSRGTLLDYM